MPPLDRYQGGMLRPVVPFALSALMALILPSLRAAESADQSATGAAGSEAPITNQVASDSNTVPPSSYYGPAPSENRYDILSKMITPMAGVLLGGNQTTDRALTLKATVGQVAGRLPQGIQGASFTVKIQYPGRVLLQAPVLGETVTVCRNGDKVWATPGSKIQFLLGQFQHKPRPHSKSGAPLELPFTSQQAVLLPVLFQLENNSDVADIGGASCRVISGGLMPEVGKAAKAEDFSAKLWICSDYTPKRIDIRRSDFAMSFLIDELSYAPGFPASTWLPPKGVTDIYHCDAARLEEVLYVVMNSLQMSASDKPWLNEATPQSPSPFAPTEPSGQGN